MSELRYTETNAANDSQGRVSLLVGLFGVSLTLASALLSVPLIVVVGWVTVLRRGKPPGYDRDFAENLWGHGHFTRHATNQEDLLP